MADSRNPAEAALAFFLRTYGARYDKAIACSAKDRAGQLTFYGHTAEHRNQTRAANPIKS